MKNVNEFISVNTARRLFDVSGKGLAAAVIATGLEMDHADFSGRIIAQYNLTPDNDGNEKDASDGSGNGTSLSGIIAAHGDRVGIAPGANLVPIKALQNQGGGTLEWINSALEWVLDNHKELDISVVCLGLGDGNNHAGDDMLIDDDAIRNSIRDLRSKRVVVTVASGNDYYKHNSQQGMSYPAIIDECVSVGAVYVADTGKITYGGGAKAFSTRPGQIAPFSQRLHPSAGAGTWTDIFAPGAPIKSSGIEGQGGESTQHGTDPATAVVTGVVLLMQELYLREMGELPEVDDVVRWLRQGSVLIYDGDDEDDNAENTHLTYPLVDVTSALMQVRRALQLRLSNSESNLA